MGAVTNLVKGPKGYDLCYDYGYVPMRRSSTLLVQISKDGRATVESGRAEC